MGDTGRLTTTDAGGFISVSHDDGIAVVAFDRPDKRNAISYEMWSALADIFPALDADAEVEVVLVTGSPGGPFSAGADIAEFQTLRSDAVGAARYSAAVGAGEHAIIACSKPTIAAIEGFAIGGGTQVAVACDLRVCGTTSRFGVTPARLGIVYSLPSTERLVETVGAAWARWILLTGDLLDAEAALRIGLVHEVVPDDEVAGRGLALARSVASRAQVSLVGGKAMIDRVVRGRLDEYDDVRAIYATSMSSAEYAEGVTAFLDKRAPDFRAARHGDPGSSADR